MVVETTRVTDAPKTAGRGPLNPAVGIALQTGEVHVWSIWLRENRGQVELFRSWLSDCEKTRAERFYSLQQRTSYIVRHGIRRLILSRYLGKHPAKIGFYEGAFGKPHIAGERTGGIDFNDSHSAGLGLIAVTRGCSVGVDVEFVRSLPHLDELAARTFSRRESAIFEALPPQSRLSAFFSCWTGKEAFVKATGEGIGVGLGKVELAINSRQETELAAVAGRPRASWKIKSFVPAPEYRGAVALNNHKLELSHWDLNS